MSFIGPVLLKDGKLTVAPLSAVTWIVLPLKAGTNIDLGSVSNAPVTFRAAPTSGEVLYLYNISIGFSTSGTPDTDDFGNSAALPNGIELRLRTMGIENTVVTIKDNFDVSLTFNLYSSTGGANGYLNNSDLFLGGMMFNSPIVLDGQTSDYIEAVVLSPTQNSNAEFRIYAHFYKEIAS